MQCSCSYCHPWPPSLYNVFSTLFHKQAWFSKKKTIIEHKMCVLIFSTSFVWNISHSKKTWARYDKKRISVFMWSTGYYCQILMKLEFWRQILEKYSYMKFQENPSSDKRSCSVRRDGQTDKTKLTVPFPQFCESTWQEYFWKFFFLLPRRRTYLKEV